MRLRKWLLKLYCVLLAGTLSACVSGNSLLSELTAHVNNSESGSSDSSSTSNGAHSNQQNQADTAASADNTASADYFTNSTAPTPSASDSQNNLWVDIRENFQLNHYANNPEVQAQIAWYMHNQEYLDRTARRAAPFMYYIYQDVKARNLPSELVLLPIIESAYNPFVSSSAGATGLWQIEPGTARSFGLRQDWWYDGRRDVTASTNAALDYLTYLQNFFGGNWLLAIAAYDTGEGNVESAIRRNVRDGRSTDYWSLPLASETEAYVPRLLALAVIISDPKDYPVKLPPISNTPYLGEVEISSQITLEQAAQLAGVSLNELKILNPGYRHTTLDPNQPYKLLLPIDRVNFFKNNLLNQSNTNSSAGLWGRYKIQSGDTWRRIAKRFNTSVGLLQQINRIDSAKPPVGHILLIPENQNNEAAIATAVTQNGNATDNTTGNTTNTISDISAVAVPANNSDHNTVITNATLARDANIEPDSAATLIDNNTLAAENNTDNTTNTTNTTTSEPSTTSSTTSTTSDTQSDTQPDNTSNNTDDKTIAQPDLSDAASLDSGAINQDTKQAAAEIASANANTGQGLHLYKITHTVKSGETISSIARSHGVSAQELARWNHLSTHSRLPRGKKIIIWKKSAIKNNSRNNTVPSRHHTHNNTNNTTATETEPGTTKTYAVQPGDTLGSIAEQHHVTVTQLEKWNKLTHHSRLHPGQHLVIY